jgi:BirA family transcriptional regulator, biotin operon repressor / biotin---[acetyl-CoA-carboxylase] ligase
MTPPQPLLPAAYRLVSRDAVGSTNDEAKQLARAGAEEGTLVWALEQTAGHGRRGRLWASPRGNLYASLIMRPGCGPEPAAQLGFVAALAVGDALAAMVPGLGAPSCKWPNDVLVGGRKIAGILLESEMGAGDALSFLVVGVGVNLVSAPTDAEFPATSILGEGRPVPPPMVALETFARHFEIWTRRWREQGFAPVRAAWRARAVALGEPIRVRLETATLHGRFVDIDQHGALLLEAEGRPRRIPAGDVFPVTS